MIDIASNEPCVNCKYNNLNFNTINVQTIQAGWLDQKKVELDVLRLDKIHPVVSGNKWFKLKYYLQEAIATHKIAVATFGGAWSNHIVATAFACKEAGLKSIGFIRGEKPAVLSETLKNAVKCGMELHFVPHEEYRQKYLIIEKHAEKDWYWINEGGCGLLGAKGAAEILDYINVSNYSYIIAVVGTGTTLAGFLQKRENMPHIIGISCMKGNFSLEKEILNLSATEKTETPFQIIHDYHFGGYGKHPSSLIDFINEIYLKHQLPLDIVYTGKTLYAIKDLTEKNFFDSGSRLLMVHSGGLQGNLSLPAGALTF